MGRVDDPAAREQVMKLLREVGFQGVTADVFEQISEAVGWYHVYTGAKAEFPRPADERSDLKKLLRAASKSADEVGSRFERLANITKARFFRLSRGRGPSLSELDQIRLNTLTPEPSALIAAVLESLPPDQGRPHKHALYQLLLDISVVWQAHLTDEPGIHRNGSRTHPDGEFSGGLLRLAELVLSLEQIRVASRTVGQQLVAVRDRAAEKAAEKKLEPVLDQSPEDLPSLDDILTGD